MAHQVAEEKDVGIWTVHEPRSNKHDPPPGPVSMPAELSTPHPVRYLSAKPTSRVVVAENNKEANKAPRLRRWLIAKLQRFPSQTLHGVMYVIDSTTEGGVDQIFDSFKHVSIKSLPILF